MDAYSISYTTASRRNSAQIYRDLRACRSYGGVMEESGRVLDRMRLRKNRILSKPHTPHVCIIGAGISGLRCAEVLLQHNIQVTILEARSRVGGRVHQIQLPGTPYLVDTGANWIHGAEDNPILDIASATGTATHSFGQNTAILDEDGAALAPILALELGETLWGIIVDAFAHSNTDTKTIPKEESLFDWFVERVKIAIPEEDEDWQRKRKLVLQMSQMWGAFVGSEVQLQSLKFFWLEESIEGGTYHKILAHIAKPSLDNGIIKFETKAVKITSNEEDGSVSVKTDASEDLVFDDVLVTVPLGWLKKHHETMFSPPLPSRIVSAISSLGYGCLEKVYITFSHSFWDPPDNTPSIDPLNFVYFLHPNYDPSNPEHWTEECISLSTLPGACAHPTLLFYISGTQSRHLSQVLPPPSSQHQRHLAIVEYFKPYYSRLANYTPDMIPVASYATSWLTDELAGNGSYSNFPIGLEQGDKDIEALRTGVPERGVWFAGEVTAPFIALGTVTGAWWSGDGVAKRIIGTYKGEGNGEVGEKNA